MEENKVKEKLMAILRTDCGKADCKDHSGEWLADQILQSQDLRVTIREKRYRVRKTEDLQPVYAEAYLVYDSRNQQLHCALFFSDTRAGIYADWLNSKEPK